MMTFFDKLQGKRNTKTKQMLEGFSQKLDKINDIYE